MSKVFFLTGSSRGLGRQIAEAALADGHRLVATARQPASLADLAERYGGRILPVALDVTDLDAATAAVAAGVEAFGQLDVVVNNAGYANLAAIEDVTPEDFREQIDANLLGVVNVTKAALPVLRAQGGGHIIQVSSIGGVQAFPTLGLYHASKWALEGLSQSLAAEVQDLGIKVTLVEPTGYETDWGGGSSVQATKLPFYDDVRAKLAKIFGSVRGTRGNPLATGPTILKVVDAEHPPLRIFFGAGPLDITKDEYAKRIAAWEKWNDLSIAAHGKPDAK